MSTVDSFGAKSTLTVGSTDYEIFRIDTVDGYEKLPFSLKVLLENLLRTEDGANVTQGSRSRRSDRGMPRPSPTPRSSSRPPAS